MGISQSTHEYYANALAQVEQKTKWRKGLIVDVAGGDKLVVADIRPILAGQPAGTLRIAEDITGTVYVYNYGGPNITTDPFERGPMYEIYMNTISDAKIGGGRKHVHAQHTEHTPIHAEHTEHTEHTKHAANLINFDEPQPNFLKDSGTNPNAHDNPKGSIEDLLSFIDAPRPASADPKNVFKSADGRAPHVPDVKYPTEHPDDNIADDDDIEHAKSL